MTISADHDFFADFLGMMLPRLRALLAKETNDETIDEKYHQSR
jgi:hypothetical protein